MLKRLITTFKYTYNIDTFVLLTFRIGEFSTRANDYGGAYSRFGIEDMLSYQ